MSRKSRWLTAEEQRAWQAYRHMRRLLDAQLERELSQDSGLSEPDYDVLSNLSEQPDRRIRARELAERLKWSSSRLTHHVTRMEGRGLVVRESCPGDARGAVVALTEAGQQAIGAAAPPHVASVRRHFVDLLTPEQLDQLRTISETVIAHLADHAGDRS
jgi:DNA-binding MarR family transcriptional regulator